MTGFLAWFVEHYPESVSIVKEGGERIFERWLGVGGDLSEE